jgi:hypothetical protein
MAEEVKPGFCSIGLFRLCFVFSGGFLLKNMLKLADFVKLLSLMAVQSNSATSASWLSCSRYRRSSSSDGPELLCNLGFIAFCMFLRCSALVMVICFLGGTVLILVVEVKLRCLKGWISPSYFRFLGGTSVSLGFYVSSFISSFICFLPYKGFRHDSEFNCF